MRKKETLIVFLICMVFALQAQDRFFTQFFSNQVDLNPALTGAIDGRYRITGTYRDQWRGYIESPYTTFGAFGDLRFAFNRNNRITGDYIGIGLSFVADKASVFDLNTNAIVISGAYHKSLNQDTKEYLSAGFNFGIAQRNINFENLTFDDQFNGLNGYTLGTNEFLPENNFAHGDFGLGLNYTISPNQNLQLTGGIAVSHIFEPSLSFFARTERFSETAEEIYLLRKYTGYASAEFNLTETTYLLPRILFLSQGPTQLLHVGTAFKFEINDYNNNALHLGGGIRLTKDLNSLAPSALILMAAYELENFLIGLSYDYNLDDLTNDREGQGIFELSLTFVGIYENEGAFCPSF